MRGKELYPQLFTYQSDWLAHIDEFGLTPEYTVSYTGQQIYAPHTKEKPVKRAILKGSTKYRDIDTGEVLDAFEDGRNLELVSVKMPVLKTSNKYDALTLLFAQKPWNYMDWTTLSFIETFNGRIKIKFKPNVSSTLRVNIFTTQENKFSNTQLKNGIDVYFTEVYHIGFYDYDNGIHKGNGIDDLKKNDK